MQLLAALLAAAFLVMQAKPFRRANLRNTDTQIKLYMLAGKALPCRGGVHARAQTAHNRSWLKRCVQATCLWTSLLLPSAGASREAAAGVDSSDAELADGSVWLSASVEAEPLLGAASGPLALQDWRVVITAPLVVDNQLPLRGSLLVWERPKARFFCLLHACLSACSCR